MKAETRPWLRTRPVVRGLLLATVILGMLNFAIFWIVAVLIGGDALAGHEQSGHYFLSNHGKVTEVSQAVFVYSKWHTLSLFVTHPLIFVAGGLMYGLHSRSRIPPS